MFNLPYMNKHIVKKSQSFIAALFMISAMIVPVEAKTSTRSSSSFSSKSSSGYTSKGYTSKSYSGKSYTKTSVKTTTVKTPTTKTKKKSLFSSDDYDYYDYKDCSLVTRNYKTQYKCLDND